MDVVKTNIEGIGGTIEVESVALDSLSWSCRPSQLLVECAQRLVEEEHPRPHRQGPGQRNTLLLAAGQLVDAPMPEMTQSHELEHLLDARLDRRPRLALRTQAEGDVLEHVHLREQSVVLEDDPDSALVRPLPDDRLAADTDVAGARILEARDDPQRGRLTRPARAEERDELPIGELQIEPLDRNRISIRAPELHEADRRRRRPHHRPPPGPPRTCSSSSSALFILSPLSDANDIARGPPTAAASPRAPPATR